MDVRLRNCQSVRTLIVYRPPNNTSCALFFEEFSRLPENVLSETSASLMITGDLNFHMENSNNAHTRHTRKLRSLDTDSFYEDVRNSSLVQEQPTDLDSAVDQYDHGLRMLLDQY
ncbi:unnamed protein product, partial [Porites lobata]